MRKISALFVASFCFLPALAAAGPGDHIASVTVLPKDAPKVVAALDTYMASSAGKQFKGRLILLEHVADGSDPASHSIVSIFHSAAEQETYNKAVANDPARKAYLDAVVAVAQLQMTGRTSLLRSWGDVVDTDRVWVQIALNVSDYAAWTSALDAWLATPKGKAFPGQGHLSMVSFGGANAPTHVVALGYDSIAEMEAYQDGLQSDADYATFQTASRKAGVRLGMTLSQEVKSWGPASMKSLTRE